MGTVVTAIVMLNAVTIPYVALRAIAGRTDSALDGAQLERVAFGDLPALWLQERFYSGHYGIFEHLMVYLYGSWFLLPVGMAALVLCTRRQQIWSYVFWYTLTIYLAVAVFLAVPVEPPWMAEPGVARILSFHYSSVRFDPDPIAAMPSLHIALPLGLAGWARSHQRRVLATALVAYAMLLSFAVLFLGEHYVIDILGAAALAAVVSGMGRVTERNATHVWFAVRRLRARRPQSRVAFGTERGQNLIEFALMTPFLLAMVFVIVQFGLAISTRSGLQQSVREAARQASVGVPITDAQAIGARNSPDRLVAADITFCLPAGPPAKVGDEIRAEIRGSSGYDYPLAGPGTSIFGFAEPSVNLAPRATTRIERPISPPDSLSVCTP